MTEFNKQPHGMENFAGRYGGMDMSLTSTGLALLDGEHLFTKRLVPTDGLRGVERLVWYQQELNDFMYWARPTVVCLENYAFNKGNQAHQVGELGGIVRMMLWQNHHHSYLVAPATLKKFITGSGGGKKSGIPLHLFKRWNLTVEQEDEADATGLALMAMYGKVHTLEPTKAQKEAVAAMTVLRPEPRLIRSRNRK